MKVLTDFIPLGAVFSGTSDNPLGKIFGINFSSIFIKDNMNLLNREPIFLEPSSSPFP